ncbi:polysaccharide lyase [Leptolyngbya sp. AN02str]|uniref:polysaccharide lyase n=1 Tax=Leptolyngbya sp. AN02str TaxID=3423363 RepID=UPI003D31463B
MAQYKMAKLLTSLVVAVGFAVGLEWYWRQQGLVATQDLVETVLAHVSASTSSAEIIPSSAELLFFSDFSEGSAATWGREQGASHQFRVENGAARFELRRNDPIASRGRRVEYHTYHLNTLSGPHWYSFRLLLPSDYERDPSQEHIAQWQGPVNGRWTSPNMALVTRDGNLVLEGAWFRDRDAKRVERTTYWRQPYETGRWVEFIFYVNFSEDDDGFVKVWKDGEQIVDFAGKTGDPYRDSVGLKIGIYKQDWARGEYSTTHTRVLYYDDVKILKD